MRFYIRTLTIPLNYSQFNYANEVVMVLISNLGAYILYPVSTWSLEHSSDTATLSGQAISRPSYSSAIGVDSRVSKTCNQVLIATQPCNYSSHSSITHIPCSGLCDAGLCLMQLYVICIFCFESTTLLIPRAISLTTIFRCEHNPPQDLHT